jgi:hypothetical protein
VRGCLLSILNLWSKRMGTAELIALILGAIPAGTAAVGAIIDDLKQRGELTDAEAADLHAKREAAFASTRWQTDDQLAAGNGPVPADTTPGGG